MDGKHRVTLLHRHKQEPADYCRGAGTTAEGEATGGEEAKAEESELDGCLSADETQAELGGL